MPSTFRRCITRHLKIQVEIYGHGSPWSNGMIGTWEGNSSADEEHEKLVVDTKQLD